MYGGRFLPLLTLKEKISQHELRKLTVVLCNSYDIFPDKSQSQHFLINPQMLTEILELASISNNDIVLEIGSGLGILSYFIAHQAKHAYLVEIDKKLQVLLENELLSVAHNVTLIKSDILKIEQPPQADIVVSNVPYHISSTLFLYLIKKHPIIRFRRAILVFQEEFAKRLCAQSGQKNYSQISALASMYGKCKLGKTFSPNCFYPKPSVNSTVIKFVPYDEINPLVKEPGFEHFLTQLFQRKHRKCKNNLKKLIKQASLPQLKTNLKKILEKRPIDLNKEEIFTLYQYLFKKNE